MAEDKVTKEQKTGSDKEVLEQQEKALTIAKQQKRQELLRDIYSNNSVTFDIKFSIENLGLVIGLSITAAVCVLVYISNMVNAVDLILRIIPIGIAFTGLLYVVANLRMASLVHIYNIELKESELEEKTKSKDTKLVTERESKDADFSKKAIALELIAEWESKEMWQARLFESALQNSARKYNNSIEEPHNIIIQQKKTEEGKDEQRLEIPALNKLVKEREILLKGLRDNDTNVRVEIKNILTVNPSQNYFRADMIKVLNFFEKLGIAIKLGIADESVLHKFFFTGVKAYHDFSKEFVEANQKNNHKIWREFIYLHGKWNPPVKSE